MTDHSQRRNAAFDNDEHTAEVRDLSHIPTECDFRACEIPLRKLSLHIARAYAAVREIEGDLRSRAGGENLVTYTTPLAHACGESCVREVNALATVGIHTVGELLDRWKASHGRFAGPDGVGSQSIAQLMSVILGAAIGERE